MRHGAFEKRRRRTQKYVSAQMFGSGQRFDSQDVELVELTQLGNGGTKISKADQADFIGELQ